MRNSKDNLPSLLRITRNVLLILAFCTVVPSTWVNQAFADETVDVVQLARDIGTNLRTAENNMFSGKNETADQQLDAVAAQIEQLKAADPGNSKLTSLESKYARVRKNLDRKLGVSTPKVSTQAPGLAPKPVAKMAPSIPAAPTGDSDALPRAVQSDVRNTQAKLDEAEAKWAEDSTGGRTVSGSTDPNEVKMDAVEQPFNSANYYFSNILNKCQKASSPCDPGHPEIAALKQRIDAMQSNIDGLQAEIDGAARASAAAAAEETEKAQAAEAECKGWNQRMEVYTNGDKALYRCVNAGAEDMPVCKDYYDESSALMDEFKNTRWASEPCSEIQSTRVELTRYMENFKSTYDQFTAEQAAAKANMGEIVFSKNPIDPSKPSNLTTQFNAGDHIYGLIQTVKPWTEIYDGKSSANVMVNVKLDGEKIHAQFVNLKTPELMNSQYMVFEIAPDPATMTAYGDPNREYGMSTATLRQGPNELTHHLSKLPPGEHTMEFDITYFGNTWSAGSFTISGSDFESYAGLHKQIAAGVSAAVTLPVAKMTNKTMAGEMQALLENAGWENIHRINIVDKDWWIDRVSGGNSAVQSRHIAAAALARDDEGYYYKVCTFHQDKLITGGFGELYLSHQGDRVPIPQANIDK